MGKKIFITLGSQKFQFNRLLKAVDELCERGTIEAADVFAQIGYSDYLPKNFNYKKFLDRDEFNMISFCIECFIACSVPIIIVFVVYKNNPEMSALIHRVFKPKNKVQ